MTSAYEPPTIDRHVAGLMNKVGRGAPSRTADGVDGVLFEDLVAEFGSPLFVFSEASLRARYREAAQAFSVRYPRVQFCWSYKTNYLDAICRVFHQEGAWAEVVSPMEYEKARRIGVPGARIVFNGPCKTPESLRRAVEEGALIHVDHFEEMMLLEEIAAALGRKVEVGLRVSLDAGVFPQWDRFGFHLESGQAYIAAKRIVGGGRLELVGLHGHIGTFILDPLAHGRAAAKLLDFSAALRRDLGARIRTLDLGGGFASTNTLHTQYLPGEQVSPSLAQYAEGLTAPLLAGDPREEAPTLLLETGRALVDEAGTLLSTVIGTKRLASGRKAVILDAGLHQLWTAWWYRLQIAPVGPTGGIPEETTVYGPLCMHIDCLRDGVVLPDLQRGARVAIRPVGAYCLTQSMQFITLRPAVVLVGPGGEVDCIRRAETLEDLVGPERIPDRLA